jgi:Flp pilus assembly protein TadD
MAAESWRVAQIVIDRGPGQNGSRGSGYLVAPGKVLTAAHVVTGASVVRVRLDVGQPTEIDVQAEGWWADERNGTDLAVLTIPENVTEGREVKPTRYGRIGDSTAVLALQAFGFPRFKLRASSVGNGEPDVFRDLEQTAGHSPVAANRRQGTLAFYLDDPPPAGAGPDYSSPWEGMSGAVVWAADRIVGVVAEHHALEGAGRLTARRVDRVYTQLLTLNIDQLIDLLGLPISAGGLPDVVPTEQGELIQSAYLQQVHDVTPDALLGRDTELTDWTEFCAGTDLYAWWQAGPWAGKTAMSSWFVTHPPSGVDIVSFFITGRLSGQADSDAFLDAMIEQLSVLVPASRGSATATRAGAGAWRNLLAAAAANAEERGRRLVVVVDGLDEDDAGSAPFRGRPSIASFLPRRPPSGVRFIVTSRPDPGLPDDLPDMHPLRTCIPHTLAASWAAKDLERRAKRELRDLFARDQTAIDVVGFVAGSGGGLTTVDLSALTEAAPYQLEPILRGVFGRSLSTRAAADPRGADTGSAERVYLFAHETLRAIAEELLGDELVRYRQKVHEWVESWRHADWPDDTPGYAIRGYPGLLTTVGDVARLSALARDPRRHAFLLRATGNDYAALMEMTDAQRLITDQDAPDLQALIELVVYRHAMSIRGELIPSHLPGVWARLGRFDHAEALARTVTDPGAQDQVLSELVAIHAQAGNLDRAEALARTIVGSYFQDDALSEVAIEAARRGDPDWAETLVHTITNPNQKVEALSHLVTAMVSAGDIDRAETMARTITEPLPQASALGVAAAALARASDMDRAEAVVRSIVVNHDPRDEALNELPAAAMAAAIDPDDARARARVEALGRVITSRRAEAGEWAVIQLVTAVAQAGDIDRAVAFANIIVDPDAREPALGAVVAAAARAGDIDGAEAIVQTITNPYVQGQALRDLAIAIAEAGDFDRAEALIRSITNRGVLEQALCDLAATIAEAGDPDRAEVVARTITDLSIQVLVFTELAALAACAGDADRVDTLADSITNLSPQEDEVLSELTTAIAHAGDVDRAEAMARTIADFHTQEQVFGELAVVIARVGDITRAEGLARAISNPYVQERVLGELASTIASSGDLHQAETLARTITDHKSRAQVLTELAAVAVHTGDRDGAYRLATNAEALARTTTIDPRTRDEALRVLAIAVVQAGDLKRAEVLARAITSTRARDEALHVLAIAVARAGDLKRAEDLARAITSSSAQRRVFNGLAALAVQVGDLDGAEALIRAIAHPGAENQMLRGLAAAIAQTGDLDRAESVARAITRPEVQARTLGALATAIAQTGDLDRAESVARAITRPEVQARTLGALATAIAQTGDLDRADRLVTEGEVLADAVIKPGTVHVFTDLAIVATQIGDPDRAHRLAIYAEALTGTIINRDHKAQALREVAAAMAKAGDFHRAEAVVLAIANPDSRAEAQRELAAIISSAGDLQRAEGLARTITKHESQVQTLADLAAVAVEAGDPDRADRLTGDAEAVARTITGLDERAEAQRELAAIISSAGDLQRAEGLARAITKHESQVQTLADLAAVAVEAGDPDRADRIIGDAEAVARTIINPDHKAHAFTELASVAAKAAPYRARHLLAQAISVEPPKIREWTEAVSRFFPEIIRDTGGVFLAAYTTANLP